jgi:hypothetical protein
VLALAHHGQNLSSLNGFNDTRNCPVAALMALLAMAANVGVSTMVSLLD